MRPRVGSLLRFLLATASVTGVAGGIAATSIPSCQTYQPPPTATITGLSDGILHDPLSPIVVKFSTPVDPSTVSVEVAPFNIDAYGNLPDEADGGSLDVLLSHTPSSDSHVSASWSSDQTTLTLTPAPKAWLPIGPSLVMLILPGATSTTTGTVLRYRQRLPFSYPAQCGTPQATQFKSGAYFFLLQVTEPIGDELKVFASIDVNPQSGAFYGQFTAALRNGNTDGCDPPCASVNGGQSPICALVPTPTCVMMTTPPMSLAEFPDFTPKATAPNGYTFAMHGCASNQGDAGAVNILTAPGELTVTSPAVRIEGLTFTAQFAPIDGGAVMGSGSLTATTAYLGGMKLQGTPAGTLSALSIPDAQAPANLPPVGAFADAGAGGDDGGAEAGGDDAGVDGS